MKKTLFLTGALLFCFYSTLTGGDLKYDAEKFKDLKKTTKKVVKADLKNLTKHGINKVVVIECWGEFLTSKSVEASTFEKRHSAWTTKSTSTIELGSDYYETAVNYVYELSKELLESNGIEVVPKATLIDNADYIELGLKEEKKVRGYTGGVGKKSVTTESLKRSTTGMGMITGVFSAIKQTVKLSQLVPKIVHDTGSNGTLKINFHIGKAKNGAPILTSYNIILGSNLKEAKAGKGKVSYYLGAEATILSTQTPIVSQADVSGSERGSVDLDKYHSALTELLVAVSDLYSYSLKEMK